MKRYIFLSFIALMFTALFSASVFAAPNKEHIRGRILLQVENKGEAWYVNPDNDHRYYMKDGLIAYNMMRSLGLGITNKDLEKIPIGFEDRFKAIDTDKDGLTDKLENAIGTDDENIDSDGDSFTDGEEVRNGYNPKGQGRLSYDYNFANKQKGKILLQVESRGEAWYVYPEDGKRYYLADGEAAYQIMRYLGLGITNADLETIPLTVEVIDDIIIKPPVIIPPDIVDDEKKDDLNSWVQQRNDGDVSTWETYKNNKFGFSFKYPSTLNIEETSTCVHAGVALKGIPKYKRIHDADTPEGNVLILLYIYDPTVTYELELSRLKSYEAYNNSRDTNYKVTEFTTKNNLKGIRKLTDYSDDYIIFKDFSDGASGIFKFEYMDNTDITERSQDSEFIENLYNSIAILPNPDITPSRGTELSEGMQNDMFGIEIVLELVGEILDYYMENDTLPNTINEIFGSEDVGVDEILKQYEILYAYNQTEKQIHLGYKIQTFPECFIDVDIDYLEDYNLDELIAEIPDLKTDYSSVGRLGWKNGFDGGGVEYSGITEVYDIYMDIDLFVEKYLGPAREKSRDAKRIADIKSIQVALELYYIDSDRDNQHYPADLSTGSYVPDQNELGWDITCISMEGMSLDCSESEGAILVIVPFDPSSTGDEPTDDCKTYPKAGCNYTYESSNDLQNYEIHFFTEEDVGELTAGLQCATNSGIKSGPC